MRTFDRYCEMYDSHLRNTLDKPSGSEEYWNRICPDKWKLLEFSNKLVSVDWTKQETSSGQLAIPFKQSCFEDKDGFVTLVRPPGSPDIGNGVPLPFVFGQMLRGEIVSAVGVIRDFNVRSPSYQVLISGAMETYRGKVYLTYGEDVVRSPHISSALEAVNTAFAVTVSQISLFNDPGRIVVQKAPKTGRGQKKGKSIYTKDRVRYVTLLRRDVRDYCHIPKTSGSGEKLKEGHERRAHLRELGDTRFRRDSSGEVRTVPVSGCWVGPDTGEDRRYKYKVRIDL